MWPMGLLFGLWRFFGVFFFQIFSSDETSLYCTCIYNVHNFTGKVWLTYGELNSARLCKVTCEEGVMYDLGIDVSISYNLINYA